MDVLMLAAQGRYPSPNRLNPEVPPPLAAMCRKAMSPRAEDRYATALDLAADLERWLADEPVSAYREPILLRLSRWSRRHVVGLTVVGGLSLLTLFLLPIVLGLFAVLDLASKQPLKSETSSLNSEMDQPSVAERAQLALLVGNVRDLVRVRSLLDDEVKRHPADFNLLTLRAGVALRFGDRVQADKDLAQALRLNGTHAEAYHYRAWLRLDNRDAQAALKDADFAIQLDANNPAFYRLRADIKQQLSDLKGAKDDLIQAGLYVSRTP
jgi:tetratricopeptide (TPR) repeat protein